jgi:hypothetical protein
MRQRWAPVAVLATVLFAINVVTRLVVRLGFEGSDTAENRASLIMFAVIGLLFAVIVFVRCREVPPSRWLPDLIAAAVAGMLLTILVGPFVSGDTPFTNGAGAFFSQVWLYGGFSILGSLLGYWIATALGVDYRSKSLKAFAEAKLTRPRRIVRR